MREIEKHAGRGNTFFRLTTYLMKHYKLELIVVMVCIVISSCASVVATVFLQRLIDECITPGITLGMGAVWSQLVSILTTMAVVYILGVIAAFTYTRIMAIVTQGTLKHMRNDMFSNMQTLPIQYFDTNSHGDIMSTYTNDTDAIRQLIGQSMPMLLQSFLTVLAMFVMMLCYSIWLTLAVCVFLVFMLFMTQKVGGASSRFMMAQQESLAKEEGFVEEMLNGQKVIQVFCHEEESKSDFVKINDQLFSDSEKAFQFGNILMPILNNVGNLMYVSLAIIGGLLLHFQVGNPKGKKGLIESAQDGTLLLDEIGELPLPLQSKLLRVLQTQKVRHVGSNKGIEVNFRLLAATNANLKEMIEQKTFREDLYYRLNVIDIVIPGLDERREDIVPLLNHFLDLNNEKYHAKKIFSNDALKFLAGCSYRGNVRELRNVVERMVIMSREDEITLSDASIAFAAMNVNEQGLPEEAAETEDFIFGEGSLKEKVAAYERKLLQQYMAKYKSGAKVAEVLQTDQSTISRKCKKYNIVGEA